eukprot:CAMPEP_0205889348 /NCGR_PEP_ID=MMETSP1083-20121108/20906_1 /ASSEMBLY_ACC=CAM_ASM_000430 /TAXON_ID=97485 /ORGANISM="Prymnesium parvum, Strain Texoma1" /LENGTH=77 /DNA_ID=CAMNT_0053253415 /DNA_START=1475 /DNA_END=1705 /DNA_ORIENTATION=+
MAVNSSVALSAVPQEEDLPNVGGGPQGLFPLWCDSTCSQLTGTAGGRRSEPFVVREMLQGLEFRGRQEVQQGSERAN